MGRQAQQARAAGTLGDHRMATDQPFIVFGAPDIQGDEIDEVVASLQARWIGTGPKVAQFEHDFAAYAGVAGNRVAAVNSCTAALHVSMLAAGLPEDTEVLTTAMTFCATANAIIHADATPNSGFAEGAATAASRRYARKFFPGPACVLPPFHSNRQRAVRQ